MEVEVDYITDRQLIEFINSKELKIQIFDVRASDIGNCMIQGAINYKATVFIKKIPEIIEKYHDYDYIVVHCMKSQNRGPMCAKSLKREFIKSNYYKESKVSIVLLKGGFSDFYNKHLIEKELFDNI